MDVVGRPGISAKTESKVNLKSEENVDYVRGEYDCVIRVLRKNFNCNKFRVRGDIFQWNSHWQLWNTYLDLTTRFLLLLFKNQINAVTVRAPAAVLLSTNLLSVGAILSIVLGFHHVLALAEVLWDSGAKSTQRGGGGNFLLFLANQLHQLLSSWVSCQNQTVCNTLSGVQTRRDNEKPNLDDPLFYNFIIAQSRNYSDQHLHLCPKRQI